MFKENICSPKGVFLLKKNNNKTKQKTAMLEKYAAIPSRQTRRFVQA